MATKVNINQEGFMPSDEELDAIHKELGLDEDEEVVNEMEEETEEVEEEVVKTPKKPTTAKKKTSNSSSKSSSAAPKKTSSKKPVNPLDVLEKINVDMNNLILNDDKSELEMIEDFEFVLNDKPTYQVVLNQSCYIAHMQGLRLADINMLNSSTGGAFESQQRVYQVLHKMINSTSIGHLDFKTFLKVTSYFDLPSLYFGTYMETFPGKTDFTITCGHCKRQIDVQIDNESFISVKDENVYSHMQDILSSVKSPREALSKSLVNKFERKMLPQSKIIIEIQTPSLNDHLNLLSSIKEDKIEEVRSMLLTLLFVKKIYFPDVKKIAETGKPVYYPIIKRDQIFRLIRDLAPVDITELGKCLEDHINKYAVEYKIKSFPCTNCKEEVGDIPVDIENLLFQEILQL